MKGVAWDGGEEFGEERVLEGCVIDESDVEIAKGCFNVMGYLFFFCKIRGESALGGTWLKNRGSSADG